MFGSILPGSYIYGGSLFGVYAAEATVIISDASAGVLIRNIAVITTHPSVRSRDISLDIEVSFSDYDIIPSLGIGVYGGFDEFGAEFYVGAGIGSYADFSPGYIVATGLVGIGIDTDSFFTVTSPDDNAVAWSKIGELNFTKEQDNLAGKKPLDWKGYVYAIKKINEKAVLVYGANGISILSPTGVFYGEKQVFRQGIKSKHSMYDTGLYHFFISKSGDLWRIDRNISFTKLGYKEFLSSMSDIVLSYDYRNDLLYICDGISGYVYSVVDNSLSEGYPTISGRAYQNSIDYIVSSANLSQDAFSIITDIENFGTRKSKTLHKYTIDTDYTGVLQICIEYRTNLQDSFSLTPWISFSKQGEAHLPCYGTDFKFRIKATTNGVVFKIDDFTVFGKIHNLSYREFLRRSNL